MVKLTRTQSTFASPVMEASRWLEGVSFTAEKPLINVSQAAPIDPPPEEMRSYLAELIMTRPEAHLYGAVLGKDSLRSEIASNWSKAYGGTILPDQVAVTSGCNQAFAAAVTSISSEGDEVILPTPWYFNHKMWLDILGIGTVPLSVGPDLLPDPAAAERLITPRTRAIALVSPNNPGGVEYPSELLRAFYDLAKRHGLFLILDATYRDFDSRADRPHDLFAQQDWHETLIQLYSFSKTYRITGHRVGAFAASADLLAQAEKFLDSVTICPNQLGQYAALWGMQNLDDWVAGERLEILDRRAAIRDNMPKLAPLGWRLLGVGAYFAYLEHPFEKASDVLAQELVHQAHVLCIPGTMFTPEGDTLGRQSLRIAFANVDRREIDQLFDRLARFTQAQ